MLLGANGTATVDALVSGNTIQEYTNTHGIFIDHSSGAPTLNATITGNTLANPTARSAARAASRREAGVASGDGGVMCLDLGAGGPTTSAAPGPTTARRARSTTFVSSRPRTRRIRFPGLGSQNVLTYLRDRNTGSPSVSATSTSTAASAFQSTANPCPQPDP